MKYIAIIETSDVGARYTGLACRRLGYEPLFIFQKNNYQADTLNQIFEFTHIETQTNNAQQIAETLRQSSYLIALVTTFLDSKLPVASELAQILNLPGLPMELLDLKDKNKVLQKAPHLFPSSLEFHRQNLNLQELKTFLHQHGTIILKPRLTAGGLGMQIVSSEQELLSSLENVKTFQAPPHLKADEWMAQAFKTGQLLSLEGYYHQGKIHFWGATGRRKVGNTESVAYFPHELQNEKHLQHSTYLRMQKQVTELMQAVNIQTAFFHIEFIVTENGASYIIDPNIGRIGGGGLIEVLALVFNLSPIDVCEFILSLSLLNKEDTSSPLSQNIPFAHLIPASTLMYGSQHGGELNSVNLPNNFHFYHTQILNTGIQIPAMGTDNWAWVGILSLPTSLVNNLTTEMKITVNGEQESLCF